MKTVRYDHLKFKVSSLWTYALLGPDAQLTFKFRRLTDPLDNIAIDRCNTPLSQ